MTIYENVRKDILPASQRISQVVESELPGFKLQFIIYRRGQRQDECERILAQLKGHPYEMPAKDLLRETNTLPESSSFIGIVIGTEKKFLGLHNQTHLMGFAAINIDSYNKVDDCLFDLYHITAQALDTYQLLNRKNLHSTKNIILPPKRNYLALARSNLKSDIFSALSMQVEGKKSAVHDLADRRARHALIAQSFHHPENYPFVISADVMDYSVKNLLNSKNQNLSALLKLSEQIAVSFDKHHLKSWINFSSPTQIMAWNGFSPEEILGTAIQTTSDPFIKATANLICEITKISPQFSHSVPNASNPFVDNETNSRNHAKLLEETFEVAISNAIEDDSYLPLIHTANSQNEALSKGRVLGWCADALQSAAKTFEQTSKKGLAPGPASRIEFQRASSQSDWETLEALNSQMLSQRRTGRAMTFGEIINLCGNKLEFRHIMESLRFSMNDPEYSAELEYVSELPKPNIKLAPANTPTPQATPAISHGMNLQNNIGGGMMGGGMGVPRSTPPPQKIIISDDEEKK